MHFDSDDFDGNFSNTGRLPYPDWVKEVWDSLMPTGDLNQNRISIVSTPHLGGRGLLYKLWRDATGRGGKEK